MSARHVLTVAVVLLARPAFSQERAAPESRFPRPAVSPEVGNDRSVTFRVQAPNAESVRLVSSDIPELGRGVAMTNNDQGVWEHSQDPLPAGAYRYNFDVDGVRVLDPVNTSTSESNTNVWSLVVVPGSDLFDTRDVPHGAVAEVTYHSRTLDQPRRMHVYTPPGYEKGTADYPVFYLLHGAFDSDDSWSTVGRTGFVLDNLIAAGRAKPMVVVMPNGHQNRFAFGAPNALDRQVDGFVEEFSNDIRPYVEEYYRVRTDRASRAIAGLSMGGAQTLEIAIRNLGDYADVGVFSSGVFGIDRRNGAPGSTWAERHAKVLDDPALKEGLRRVWFATGKQDFLINTSRETVRTLRDHGFEIEFSETEGGHTWLNWRDYLTEFTPELFRDEETATRE